MAENEVATHFTSASLTLESEAKICALMKISGMERQSIFHRFLSRPKHKSIPTSLFGRYLNTSSSFLGSFHFLLLLILFFFFQLFINYGFTKESKTEKRAR